MTTETPTPRPNIGRLVRLARKELTEILRDRRTIVTLIVMPLLLYPLLSLGFALFPAGNKGANGPPLIRIGFIDEADQREWQRLLGEQDPTQLPVLAAQAVTSCATPNLASGLTQLLIVRRIQVAAVRHDQPNNLAYFGANKPADQADNSAFDPMRGLEDALRDGNLDLVFQHRNGNSWHVLYNNDNLASREAMALVQERALSAQIQRLDRRLTAARIDHATPVHLVPFTQPSEGGSGFSLRIFVPLVLILMTITGAVYPAIDLTAGERERGTLEVLVAAPIPRFSVLAAKYLTVLTVAVLTAVVNLVGMTLSLLVTGFASEVFGPGGLSLLILLEIFALVLLFAAFFSAVLLVVTSFARSFKEAQAYLIPLMVVSLAPGLVGLYPGLELSPGLAIIPLLNIVLLARDLLVGHAHWGSAILVVFSTAGYAVLAILLAARVFGAEGVLYGESSGWRELFRRR